VEQANLFLLEVEEAHQVPQEASEEQEHQEGEGATYSSVSSRR
jgi:hypothetical protein